MFQENKFPSSLGAYRAANRQVTSSKIVWNPAVWLARIYFLANQKAVMQKLVYKGISRSSNGPYNNFAVNISFQ